MIQPVERTISLEIVHPEVQRCFLRCFNDGYKNSNLRPAAGDWVKALRFAVNELTICGKVDSHYYSRTYGECYWCDRSTKLGIDIFPGFARPKQQSAFVESTSQSKVFLDTKTLELVNQEGKIITVVGKVINIHYSQQPIGRNVLVAWIVGIGLLLCFIFNWSIMFAWFCSVCLIMFFCALGRKLHHIKIYSKNR
ncbi:hypothetical protein [Nostoc sp. NMS2]|uniref:hypothetical protein n=1 Tax=Nostoc sp. NMS2 TaxID=2815389 RepID=UPI0025D1EA3C|nr:hypothetical protein [Nostoc sp. NMS2]